MDIVSRQKRSAMMGGIRSRDTRPEIAVRLAAPRLGLRFRLHRRHLPGSPDLIFPRRKTALLAIIYLSEQRRCTKQISDRPALMKQR